MQTVQKTDVAEAQELLAYDKEYVLHSWSIQNALNPPLITGAKGIYFWDSEGKKYMDFASQLINSNIGHQHPKVVAAIKEQAEKLTYMAPSFATEPRARAAKLLAEVSPGDLKMTFFTNGGAEANENAIKMARAYTGKQKIISKYRSYHGATYATMSVGGDNRKYPVEPGVPGSVHVPEPYCYRCSFAQSYPSCNLRCAEYIREVIQYEGPETVAAVIFESVTGGNGVIIPPDGYMQRLREICDANGVLMIADEVMSGFGRCGTWFAIDNWNVTPDILSFAKGVNSGYVPLGGAIVREKIGDWYKDKMLWAGLTYSGHALACAAAVATMEAYRDEKLIENSAKMGAIMKDELLGLQEKHPSIGEVRSIGLFSALELVKNRETREPLGSIWSGVTPNSSAVAQVGKKCMAQGLNVSARWNNILVAPPIIVNESEIKEGIALLDKALEIADAEVK